jgi:hypothetical protein
LIATAALLPVERQLGRPKIAEQTELAVRTALKKKNRPGLRKIAATLGVGVGTVQRISRELATFRRKIEGFQDFDQWRNAK